MNNIYEQVPHLNEMFPNATLYRGFNKEDPIVDFAMDYLFTFLFEVAVGGVFLYFLSSGLMYYYTVYHKIDQWAHIQIPKGQIRKEISMSVFAVMTGAPSTAVFHTLVNRGYTKIYWNFNDYSVSFFILSTLGFLFFTETCVYWVHRLSHHPLVYKDLHKHHHVFILPTPWGGMAFHPVDAFGQLLPHLIFPYFCPVYFVVYFADVVYLGCWAAMIHDNYSFIHIFGLVLGSTHHQVHHFDGDYNYGQWTTIWDRLTTSHWHPDAHKAHREKLRKIRAQKLQ